MRERDITDTIAGKVAASAIIAGCVIWACKPSTPPAPTTSAAQITTELEAADCLAPGTNDVDAVAAEMALTNRPAWLSCMADGGSVAACNVPCTR